MESVFNNIIAHRVTMQKRFLSKELLKDIEHIHDTCKRRCIRISHNGSRLYYSNGKSVDVLMVDNKKYYSINDWYGFDHLI